ncbi:site-2 protease family protein [Candidatus Dependentiae bacterium]|nr:site-2 protease family protein [Candidatus Dependentiae bacterium]
MFKDFIKNLVFICVALIGLTGVITIHELGHWSFCKLFGVHTPRFSIGFGPALLKKEISNTEFVLAAFPVGGYVSIAGVDTTTPKWLLPYSFISKPYWQKVLILLGGILFNILFGLSVLALRAMLKRFGIKAKEQQVTITEPLAKKGAQFIGPLGIISLISRAAQSGFSSYGLILAALSLNVAFFNLIPLPFFDGGQLLVYSIEAFTGKELESTTYDLISTLSLVAFLVFTLVISFKDVLRIFKKS